MTGLEVPQFLPAPPKPATGVPLFSHQIYNTQVWLGLFSPVAQRLSVLQFFGMEVKNQLWRSLRHWI